MFAAKFKVGDIIKYNGKSSVSLIGRSLSEDRAFFSRNRCSTIAEITHNSRYGWLYRIEGANWFMEGQLSLVDSDTVAVFNIPVHVVTSDKLPTHNNTALAALLATGEYDEYAAEKC